MSLLKILENYSWAEGPETTISFSNSLGLRSLCVVILRAVSFHSKRIQNTINRGKRCVWWSPGEARHKLPKQSGRVTFDPASSRLVSTSTRRSLDLCPSLHWAYGVRPLCVYHKARLWSSRRKHKPHYRVVSANAPGRVGTPTGEQGGPPRVRPQMPARGPPCKQAP